MSVGVALLGVTVSVVAWDLGLTPAPAGGSVSPVYSVEMAGESVYLYG